MANDADNVTSTRSTGAKASTLLPPQAALLPSSGSHLLNLQSKGGDDLAGEMARAGAEAKELAARAAAFAAEKAPEVRKKAQDAATKAGELAHKVLKEGAVPAALAREALADPEKRRALLVVHRKKLLVGLVAVIAAIGGGWLYAGHEADIIARDRIDGFLIRQNLQGIVAYDDVAGSPFGSAVISGIRITVSPAFVAKIGAVTISHIKMKGDMIQSISVAAKSAEIPLLAMARDSRRLAFLDGAIGMGYTTLSGDIDLSANFDEQAGILSLATSGDIRDAGSWTTELKLGGLNARILDNLYSAARSIGEDGGLGLLGIASTGINYLTLSQASLTLDNSGYFQRNNDVPDVPIPVDADAASTHSSVIDEAELVRAGMSPSEALATQDAVAHWTAKGGRLSIETDLAQPMPLFRGGSPAAAFGSLAAYLAATQSKVSN